MKKSILKKLLTLNALLFALCLLPFSSLAADLKFGSMDLQKALNESEAGKKAKSDLEALIKSKESVINEKSKVVEKLRGELEKQSSVLSAEARKSREDELEKLLREYQRAVQDSQAEVKKKEGELTEAIIKELREIVEKIGEEEGYTLIIERGLVLYSNKGIDLTDTVIKKYNELKAGPKK
jgi:outer membrane protein